MADNESSGVLEQHERCLRGWEVPPHSSAGTARSSYELVGMCLERQEQIMHSRRGSVSLLGRPNGSRSLAR
jgi:hypothetical protein